MNWLFDLSLNILGGVIGGLIVLAYIEIRKRKEFKPLRQSAIDILKVKYRLLFTFSTLLYNESKSISSVPYNKRKEWIDIHNSWLKSLLSDFKSIVPQYKEVLSTNIQMLISETISNLEPITLSCDWVFDIESIQPSKPPLSSILEDIVKLVQIIKDALKELGEYPLVEEAWIESVINRKED